MSNAKMSWQDQPCFSESKEDFVLFLSSCKHLFFSDKDKELVLMLYNCLGPRFANTKFNVTGRDAYSQEDAWII